MFIFSWEYCLQMKIIFMCWPLSFSLHKKVPTRCLTVSGWQKESIYIGKLITSIFRTVIATRSGIKISRSKPWFHPGWVHLWLSCIQSVCIWCYDDQNDPWLVLACRRYAGFMRGTINSSFFIAKHLLNEEERLCQDAFKCFRSGLRVTAENGFGAIFLSDLVLFGGH